MRLERLEISGFFHFPEPSVLDLRAVPEGLVAVTGPNGGGKTRIMDAPLASLYGPGVANRAFPSREGTLATYATQRDAYIDSQWDVDSLAYRVRVSVDGVHRTSEAVIADADGPFNDGKVTTFRDEVARRFPSRRSVLCSAFASQNKAGSFVELGQKERMELFAELTDLSHYQLKHETAKACAAVAERVHGTLAGACTVLRDQTSDWVRAELARKGEAVALQRLQQDAVVAEAQRQAQDWTAQCATHEEAAARFLAAHATRGALANAIAEKQDALAGCRKDVMRETEEREAALADLAERIANNRAILADAPAIRQQALDLAETSRLLEQARAEAATVRDGLARRTERVADLKTRIAAHAGTDRELADARTQDALVAGVPCHGEGAYAQCQFLARAQQARTRIVPLLERLEEAKDLQAELAAAVLNRDDSAALLQAADALAGGLAQRLAGYDRAKLAPMVDLAEARIEQYQAQVQAAEAASSERLARLAARKEALLAEQRTLVVALEAALAEVAETEQAKAALDAARKGLATAQRALQDARQQAGRLDSQQEEVRRLQADLDRKAALLGTLQGRLATVESEWLAWKALAVACGRDGLQRLEVDAAGPSISDTTNALLAAAFGTRFTLQLVTQVARADGKGMKEQFTIEVYDNDHGGEARDIADLSGGERVVVEEALRAAIAVFVNRRNRQPVRTCWRDETTGALDPDNVPRYVAMLRRMHEIGGFAHTLFVTHSPEAAALADAQVRVQAGALEVALPPY